MSPNIRIIGIAGFTSSHLHKRLGVAVPYRGERGEMDIADDLATYL